MRKPSKRILGAALVAAALAGAAPASAHGRVHFGIGFNFGPWWGPDPFWGPAWYYPPPYYSYYYYPPAVVVAPAQPHTYVERNDQAPQQAAQPQSSYWYYCEASRTYYPYVKECPGGWKAVAPSPPPPSQ